MGICAAVNCSNKSNKSKGITLFSLPKNEDMRKKWLVNLKRDNLPKDVRICSVHFEESCFKRDLEVCKSFNATLMCTFNIYKGF